MAKANFERAKGFYPSTEKGDEFWVAVLEARPDIMWAILADIYNAVVDEQEREAGVHRVGRRPRRAAGSFEELYRVVFPNQYTQDPFPLAFKKLLGDRSQRQLALRIPCNQSTISRLLTGELKPDRPFMESVAKAMKVPPHYFIEYRAQFIGELIERILTEQPHLGITAYKQVRGGTQ